MSAEVFEKRGRQTREQRLGEGREAGRAAGVERAAWRVQKRRPSAQEQPARRPAEGAQRGSARRPAAAAGIYPLAAGRGEVAQELQGAGLERSLPLHRTAVTRV